MFLPRTSGSLILFAAMSVWALVPASAAPDQTEAPERISVLVTYGDDACPETTSEDEIVVCANKPESERYRIPEELRKAEEVSVVDHSWTSTVGLHQEAARAGRPNSCSVNGTNGFTGCQSALMRQWFDERRALAD